MNPAHFAFYLSKYTVVHQYTYMYFSKANES
jgi:hypothetical protein